MKTFKNKLFTCLLVLSTTITLNAQTIDLESVKAEITEAALKEQNAFKNGDCTTVLDMMEPNITFLANGNSVPSKKVIEKFCNSLARPFKEAIVDTLEIYPLTMESGYTIRRLEYANDAEAKMQEYVTKIWRKTDGQWRISHLHSTVKKVSISE
jgi:ketosteroid isomerase-like protein